GTADGVSAVNRQARGARTVRNGRIVEGAGGGGSCHAIRLDSVHDVRVSHVDVTVAGPDADGISLTNLDGDVRVDHDTVRCATTVVSNRHFPGLAAIRLDGAPAGA